ncbi:GLPGLI family protein [Chryseobacterium sp. WLY505]|uniref:GLPGLI family protein n=1 Tax=Chryseobacterium sp. WLY505 TaxID=3068892 RepID=UPI002796A0DC|nr:GLPGLI family protein [Chryseobacterium sp. WLY505]MDQ1858520.1 GLPGLI family protein [Chryseobacterium sp. WLY505]
MKNFTFIFYPFIIMFISFLNAQNFSFIYELSYKPNSDNLKYENFIFYLDIKDKSSVFRSYQFRLSDSLRAKKGIGNGFDMEYNNKQLYVYKKNNNREIFKYVFVPLIHSVYAIPVNEDLHWKITKEKKKIANYNCQKAEVEYGGRKWDAWFTNEIPLPQGPYVFYGLPGLIVKISDEKFDYDFELIQIKDFKWKELYTDKFQKQITWEDFQKLQKNYYTEPLSMIKKSDIIAYDENGNIMKTNFKEMKENIQKRTREKNNPIELNYKAEYK